MYFSHAFIRCYCENLIGIYIANNNQITIEKYGFSLMSIKFFSLIISASQFMIAQEISILFRLGGCLMFIGVIQLLQFSKTIASDTIINGIVMKPNKSNTRCD